MFVNLIVAIDEAYAIGRNGEIPWGRLKYDMKYFREMTSYGYAPAVLMGRKTWESMNKRPLKNRMNIVVSSTMDVNNSPGCIVVRSFQEGVNLARSVNRDALWVIGGEALYAEAIHSDLLHELHVTFVKGFYEDCDAFFPFEDVKMKGYVPVRAHDEHKNIIVFAKNSCPYI